MRQFFTGIVLLIISATSLAAGPPAPMTKVEFDTLMKEISNWGRWGKDDELGTLNLITPAKRVAAAALVKDGITVSLALDLNKIKDELNANPFEHELSVADWGGHQVAGDKYSVEYHGLAHSHMDGLPHFAHKGFFYNGVPYTSAKPSGTERLGIHNVGINGVFTRGVLVDMPSHLGVKYLEPGVAITVSDIESWEVANKVKISSGDVLLIRTGRWAKVANDGQWSLLKGIAGSHASLAAWLKTRDVAIIGSDGANDVAPSGVEGLFSPLHELVLVGLGMPIFDNLDLELLAKVAKQKKRPAFLFAGAPLRVKGGTGSPVNPLAVF
jgi:kynurenine formamidase